MRRRQHFTISHGKLLELTYLSVCFTIVSFYSVVSILLLFDLPQSIKLLLKRLIIASIYYLSLPYTYYESPFVQFFSSLLALAAHQDEYSRQVRWSFFLHCRSPCGSCPEYMVTCLPFLATVRLLFFDRRYTSFQTALYLKKFWHRHGYHFGAIFALCLLSFIFIFAVFYLPLSYPTNNNCTFLPNFYTLL